MNVAVEPFQFVSLVIPAMTGIETLWLEDLADEVPDAKVRIGGSADKVYAIVEGPSCYVRYVEYLFHKLYRGGVPCSTAP